MVMNRVLGFKDPVLCDAFVCDCMGYSVDDVPYITMAENWGGKHGHSPCQHDLSEPGHGGRQ